MNCPDCGEPLDDFGPCACVLANPRARDKYRGRLNDEGKFPHMTMRQMVERKLKRQGKL